MQVTANEYTSSGRTVPVEVFAPPAGAKTPTVLIIHGSSGLGPKYRPDIESFALALKGAGLSAVLPHYFAAAGVKSELTSDTEGLQLIGVHYATWRTACRDALAFVAADPRFDPSRLGVVGFSLGGHYALDLAMAPPAGTAVKAVVEFFAPTTVPPLPPLWSAMPPLQVHHGKADTRIPLSETHHLQTQLAQAGKKPDVDFWVKTYDGQGHGFTGDALTQSRDATVRFLASTL